MEPQLTSFRDCFVRINSEDGIPVGAGFLVSDDGHVLTCAHVVAAALGDDTIQARAEIPRGTLNLNFHFLEDQPLRIATVVHWQPRVGSQTNPSGDIAILRLTKNQPDEARPIRLSATNELFDHEFRAHGFPRDTDSGVWAYGVVRDPLGNGWLQIEDTKEQGRRIEQGFSGGPVQDRRTGGIVGMVAASSEYIKAAKVGYVIPTELLAHAWPDLHVETLETKVSIDAGGTLRGLSLRDGLPRTSSSRTHTVDAMYHGDYVTIIDAIEAAAPGDRILVRPGFYEEGLVLDKPLEIVGQGDLADIVVRARGSNALAFNTSMGRVSNLTLRQTGTAGDLFGVDIVQGRLELDGCDISSESAACVGVHGSANPILRNNRIHDSEQSGVYIYGGGTGFLEDNDIFNNALAGATIGEGGNIKHLAGVTISGEGSNGTLRDNRIHDNNCAGVVVGEGGKGTLEDNDIFGHSFYGVAINGEGSNSTLRDNRIYDNKGRFGYGALVNGGGKGTLKGNEIFANEFGVNVSGEGTYVTLRTNRIQRNEINGVFVFDKAGGRIEDNDLSGDRRGKKPLNIRSDSEPNVISARNKM